MKKTSYILLSLISLGAIWYFFIKPADYIVNFKAKTTPGTIIQSLETWNLSINNTNEIGAKITGRDSLNSVTQQFHFGDSLHVYTWDITPENDSVSNVSVGIKDPDHSLTNKLKVIFKDTDFQRRSTSTVKDFYIFLEENLKQIRITIDGKSETPATYCAYIPLKGVQIEKAEGMMRNYGFLSGVLAENAVKLNGPPLIEVTHWNPLTDSLAYNFCFPIERSEKLPQDPEIKYKKMLAKPALKATYNGNYITSDRAWYALLAYAKSHKIPIEKKPMEVFYNNPNMGGNALGWKAEIYMPIKGQKN